MKITQEHIGTIVVEEYGSYVTRTTPSQRRPRLRLVTVVAINPADDCEFDIFVGLVTPDKDGSSGRHWVHRDKLSSMTKHAVPGFAPNDRVLWADETGARTIGNVVGAVLGTVVVRAGVQWYYFGGFDGIPTEGKTIDMLTNLED